MDSIDNYRNKIKFGNKRKYNYDTGFRYSGRCSNNSYTQYNWYRGGSKYPKRYRKAPVRPPSPLQGTEEYRQRKIQHTSELIKRKLLTGENISDVLNYESDKEKYGYPPHGRGSDTTERRHPRTRTQSLDSNLKNDKHKSKDLHRVQKTSTSECIDVEEIHNKIMKYITNLNHGRKVNLINSATSFYDNAIEQIQIQKRLELSRALRAMCSNEATESVDVINSIIPDIGIKLEDLPRQVIEQLSLTLDFDYEEQADDNLLQNAEDKPLKQETISYHKLNNHPSTASTVIRNKISEQETIRLQDFDSPPNSFTNCPSPSPTVTGNSISSQKTVKLQDMHNTRTKLIDYPSTASTIIRNDASEYDTLRLQDFYSPPHSNTDCPSPTPVVGNSISSQRTVKLQDIDNADATIMNHSSTLSTVDLNHFEDSVNWPYSGNIKTEMVEDIDEAEEGSIETVLLDDAFVRETNDFLKHQDHIDSYNGNKNDMVWDHLKQEQLIDEFEDQVDGDSQSHNVSDDCIILPPKPIEVIDVDEEPTPKSVSTRVNIKLPIKKEQVNSKSGNNIASEETSQNNNHRHISTSDFCVQVNYNTLYDENPKTLHTAIELMLQIDKEIERLTTIRRNLFISLDVQRQNSVHPPIVHNNPISSLDSIVLEPRIKTDTPHRSKENSERALKRLTKKYIGHQSPQSLKTDRFNSLVTDSQVVNSHSNRTPQNDTCSSSTNGGFKSANSSRPPSTNLTNVLLPPHWTANISSAVSPKSLFSNNLPHGYSTPSRPDVPPVPVNSLLINVAPPGTDPSRFLNCVLTGSGITNMGAANKELFGSKDDLQFIPPNIAPKGKDEKANGDKAPIVKNDNILVFNIKQKVLVAHHVGKRIFLGTENGKLFVASLHNGTILKVVSVSSQSVTCFSFLKTGGSRIYVGTLSLGINAYDINSYRANDFINTQHSVQCMEREWGYIFVGCQSGKLYRYSLSKKKIEFEDMICNTSIMAVKAVLEGARKVLLVASRGSPICIRDAISALHMRTVDPMFSPTIYSMLVHKGDIYCGTLANDLLVYSFYDGVLKAKLKDSDAKGISCLKFVSPLIFASCYDGFVYVYHTSPRKFIGKIEGPGGTILSMEIYKNKVLVGTNKPEFVALIMPEYVSKIIPQALN